MNPEPLLNFDAVAEAEKAGLSTDQMLGLAIVANQAKRQVLESMGDTHHSMSMQSFLTCCIMHGFKVVYQEELVYIDEYNKTEQHDMFYILWDGSKLIVCDSFHGSLNGGDCYFSWRAKDKWSRPVGPCSNGLAHGSNTDFGAHIDVREGLFYWLEKNGQLGEFITPHVESCEPWLTTYVDSKQDNRPWHERATELQAKSKARAAKLPKEVLDNLVGRYIK